MPIISDGNNQIGDEVTDRHTTVGVTKHTGSYHVSGTSGNYILVNSDDMTMQMSVAPGGANVSVAPHIGAFDNTLGVQPTIAVGRGDDTKSFGGQFALTRLSSTGSVGPGDILGSVVSMGHDGTDFNVASEIRFAVDGAVATGLSDLDDISAGGTLTLKSAASDLGTAGKYVTIAIDKMKKNVNQATNIVAASDAFFPFIDGIEKLVQAGVKAVIQPAGSIKDKAIIKFANETNTVLIFSKTRHFRH